MSLVLYKPPLTDDLRAFAAKLGDYPDAAVIGAMTTWVARAIEQRQPANARLAMATIYREYYGRVPAVFRPDLDRLAGRLEAEHGPRRPRPSVQARRRKAGARPAPGPVPQPGPGGAPQAPIGSALVAPPRADDRGTGTGTGGQVALLGLLVAAGFGAAYWMDQER